MMKTILTCFISLGYSSLIFAQTAYSIQGKLLSEDKTALQDGIVSIYFQRDSTLYKTVLIDSNGNYFLDQIVPNTYYMYIEAKDLEGKYIENIFVNKNISLNEI